MHSVLVFSVFLANNRDSRVFTVIRARAGAQESRQTKPRYGAPGTTGDRRAAGARLELLDGTNWRGQPRDELDASTTGARQWRAGGPHEPAALHDPTDASPGCVYGG